MERNPIAEPTAMSCDVAWQSTMIRPTFTRRRKRPRISPRCALVERTRDRRVLRERVRCRFASSLFVDFATKVSRRNRRVVSGELY